MPDNSVENRLSDLLPTHLFATSRVDRELVATFFMLFARAEFALKKAGFVDKEGGAVNVKWDKFAEGLGSALVAPADLWLAEAVKYLKENPPRKQEWRNGRLEWKNRNTTSESLPVSLIRSVTTVRNNLFHGGKEVVGVMAERDRFLLQHSLLFLAYCLTQNKDVLAAFGELGPEVAVA